MTRRIMLKQGINIKGELWPAKEYGVPEEMSGALADWLLKKRPDIASEVRERSLADYLPEEGPPEAEVKPEAKPAPKVKLLVDKVAELTDHDEAILFGTPGVGKSLIAWRIAKEAKRAGKKVLYLDCERNLPKKCVEELGDSYTHFAPTMDAMLAVVEEDRGGKKVCRIPKGCSFVVLDSIGYPGLAEYWGLPEAARFRSFGHVQRISNHIKNYCYENHACALTLDQPVSEIAEAMGRERGPYGGKIGHTAKTIWQCELTVQKPELTRGRIVVWKARDRGRGALIAEYEISSKGVSIDWKV